MKEVYDIGIVFRGFILVNKSFKELSVQKDLGSKKDLRGAFISAISSFAESAFKNNNLEYLESGNILFIFKMSNIKSSDNSMKEPIILYGLVEKKKKNPNKIVKKFLTKGQLVLESFTQKYDGCDFTEISQFESFKEDLQNYFIKKQDSSI